MHDYHEQASNKEFLQSIVENEYELPEDIEPSGFANALLANLGSNDSELRDDLSYMILASGIIAKQKLNTTETLELLNTTLDSDHLFTHIGERNTDTVFMRSFSNSILAAILYNEISKPVFDAPTIEKIRDSLYRYAREEKDWRGYVEGKGWVQTMAHLADALDEYAQHPSMKPAEREKVLQVLSDLVRLPEPLYDKEDIRLAKIAFHIIIGKQVDGEALQNWISSCVVVKENDPSAWTRQNNARNFLRSLFFLLYWNGLAPATTEHISSTLKQIDEEYLDQVEEEV